MMMMMIMKEKKDISMLSRGTSTMTEICLCCWYCVSKPLKWGNPESEHVSQ